MNSCQKKILKKNIQYLLSNLDYGENSTFTNALGMSKSTVTRWKNGSHLPDSYSLGQICSYFDIKDCNMLITKDLQSDPQYIPPKILKQYCINVIRHMNLEEINKLLNYFNKLQNLKQDDSPVHQYLNSLCGKSIDYYELIAGIMVQFNMSKESAQKEFSNWINIKRLEA